VKAAEHDPYAAMLRGALLPTLAVAVVALGVSAFLGSRALVGSALGAGVVVVFFALTLLVMRTVRTIAPELMLGVALLLYGTKIAVIGGLVFWLRGQEWLSPTSFAVTAFTCAVVWLAGQVRGFTRMRVLVADPEARS
jgi:ATP synthase protein I